MFLICSGNLAASAGTFLPLNSSTASLGSSAISCLASCLACSSLACLFAAYFDLGAVAALAPFSTLLMSLSFKCLTMILMITTT